MEGIERHGVAGAKRGFKHAISLMNNVEYDRSNPRPTVLIVGEYLLNFHPGANRDIEAYLERNGFEIIEARMTDVIRKTYFYQDAQSREFHVTRPAANVAFNRVANALFEHAHDVCDRIGKAHPLYEPPCRMGDLVQASDPIIHHTFDAGEGVLIAAEILHRRSMAQFFRHLAAVWLPSPTTSWGAASSSSSRNAIPMRIFCRSITTPM